MPVNSKPSDSLQGTLELLILKTLASGPNHGFGITLHIQSVSEGLLRVEEGSLYPALHRMEEAGWIRAEWAARDNGRPARLYELTAAGRKQLASTQARWTAVTGAVGLVLKLA